MWPTISPQLIERHAEAGLGQIIFPKLAGIVKENAGDEQIEIQVRIKRRNLLSRRASSARCARPTRRAARDDRCARRRCCESARRTCAMNSAQSA